MVQDNQLGIIRRIIDTITGKRKKIFITGYHGSGKTTIYTVLDKKRDVSDSDVPIHTRGVIPYYIEYETSNGKKVYIKSVDSAGDTETYKREVYERILKKHDYILYLLNSYEYYKYMNNNKSEYSKTTKEECDTWLKYAYEFAKEHGKIFMLVLSHADEIFHEEVTNHNKNIIRDLFLGDSGFLNELKCDCTTEVANVQKYDQVKEIIDQLIEIKNEV